jgi:protoporphyrinogen IX oxidase
MADGAKPGVRAAVALAITAAAIGAAILLFGERAYDWVKSAHVIAIISWMAGMLYLPRLFIYHCDAPKGSQQSETFKVMEQRLMRIIVNPAMILSWALGLWLAWKSSFFTHPWFIAKLVMVSLLSGVHGYLSASVRRFGEDRNDKPARHWRIVNEAPTVLMVVIVILVIVKPWL